MHAEKKGLNENQLSTSQYKKGTKISMFKTVQSGQKEQDWYIFTWNNDGVILNFRKTNRSCNKYCYVVYGETGNYLEPRFQIFKFQIKWDRHVKLTLFFSFVLLYGTWVSSSPGATCLVITFVFFYNPPILDRVVQWHKLSSIMLIF